MAQKDAVHFYIIFYWDMLYLYRGHQQDAVPLGTYRNSDTLMRAIKDALISVHSGFSAEISKASAITHHPEFLKKRVGTLLLQKIMNFKPKDLSSISTPCLPRITIDLFDHSSFHTLRVEKINGILSWKEYAQWMIQLCQSAHLNFFRHFVHPLPQYKAALIAGIKKNLLLDQLQASLSYMGAITAIKSYPLTLAYKLRQRAAILYPHVLMLLLVMVDAFEDITLTAFKENHLIFVRSMRPSPQVGGNVHMRHAIEDSLNYLHHNYAIVDLPIFIFQENHTDYSNLMDYFPQAFFIKNQALRTFSGIMHKDRIFHQLIFSHENSPELFSQSPSLLKIIWHCFFPSHAGNPSIYSGVLKKIKKFASVINQKIKNTWGLKKELNKHMNANTSDFKQPQSLIHNHSHNMTRDNAYPKPILGLGKSGHGSSLYGQQRDLQADCGNHSASFALNTHVEIQKNQSGAIDNYADHATGMACNTSSLAFFQPTVSSEAGILSDQAVPYTWIQPEESSDFHNHKNMNLKLNENFPPKSDHQDCNDKKSKIKRTTIIMLVLGFLLISSYMCGVCWCLLKNNIALTNHLKKLAKTVKNAQIHIKNIPVTQDHMHQVITMQTAAIKQHQNLMQFLDLVHYVLADQYVLNFLSISQKKMRLEIDPVVWQGSWDSFLDLWHYTLFHYPLLTAPDTQKSPLLLELTSPFSPHLSSKPL